MPLHREKGSELDQSGRGRSGRSARPYGTVHAGETESIHQSTAAQILGDLCPSGRPYPFKVGFSEWFFKVSVRKLHGLYYISIRMLFVAFYILNYWP